MAVPCLKSDYTHRHTHVMPMGPLSATCTDKDTCWGHKKVFDKS